MSQNARNRTSGSGGYILALDGVRALAIVLVFIFHLNERWLPGGFIGVDVFFVISGFIITRSILSDMYRGTYSFGDFYKRRIARLLPSVLATFLMSIVAASFVYGPNQLQELSKAGIFSIFSLANVYFYLNTGYFDDASQANLFLHNWSLSVEEQFYLVWPWALYLFHKYVRNTLATAITATIVFVIFAYAFFLKDPSAAFYLMPMRAFQFSAGAVIALAALRNKTLLPRKAYQQAAFLALGVGLVLYAGFFGSGQHYSFWVAAVIPVAGTVLILLAIDRPAAMHSFGLAPLRFIGLRAYAIYLVHWPIIVLIRIFLPINTVPYLLAVFGLTAVCAEFLHRFVEKKFRITAHHGLDALAQTSETRRKLAGIAALSVLSMAVATVTIVTPHWLVKQHEPLRAETLSETMLPTDAREISMSYTRYASLQWQARSVFGHAHACQPQTDDSFKDFDQIKCVPYRKENDGVLILGDSYAAEARIILSQFIDDDRLLQTGAAGCRPIYNDPDRNKRSELCNEMNDFRFNLAARDDVEVIFVISNWRGWREDWVRSTLDYLTGLNKPVFVLGARPLYLERVPTLLDSAAGATLRTDLSAQFAFDPKGAAAMLDKVVRSYKGAVTLVDTLKFFCPDACPAFTPDGAMIYLDTAHITASAAAYFGKRISEVYSRELQSVTVANIVSQRSSPRQPMMGRADVVIACPRTSHDPAISAAYYGDFDGRSLKDLKRRPKSSHSDLWSGRVDSSGDLVIDGFYQDEGGEKLNLSMTLARRGVEFVGSGRIGDRKCHATALIF